MDIPLELSFHNMDPSPALKDAVDKHVKGLEKFFDHIVGMRVSIEMPHKSHASGHNIPDVHLLIRVPGKELVVTRELGHADTKKSPTDAYAVLDDAFRAAAQQIKEYRRVTRGEVKHKEVPQEI